MERIRSGLLIGMLWALATVGLQAQDFTFFEAPRYITHITSPGGGFASAIILNNSGSTAKEVNLSPYDTQGRLLSQAITVTVKARTISEVAVSDTLPPDTSHFLISGSRRVLVSVRYDSTSGVRGLWTNLHESDLAETKYHIYPGTPPESRFWEGAAIVNLVPNPLGEEPPVDVAAPKVEIDLINRESNNVIARHTFDLHSSAKALKVFGSIFPEARFLASNTFYYEIRSTVPLGVTALMGNLVTNDIASAHPAAPLSAEDVVNGDIRNLDHVDYKLFSAELDEDVISIRFAFDVSCRFTPTLFWSGDFMESQPPQTQLKLALLGSSRTCLGTEASLVKEFDLGSITRSYLGSNGKPMPITINLMDGNDNVFESFTLNESDN